MRSHSFIVMGTVVVLLTISLFLTVEASGQDGADFASITALYDPSTEKFTGLNEGDRITFEDYVSIRDYSPYERNTKIWFQSTGGSIHSWNLTFPGDLSQELLPGSKIKMTVEIMAGGSGNHTFHFLTAQKEDILILEEGEGDDIPVKKEEIDVFGYKIKKDDLPSYLQSNWARFGVAVGIWTVLIGLVWLIFRVLLLFTKRTKIEVDHTIVNIVRFPFFLLVFVYGVIVSLSQLEVQEAVIDVLDTIYRAVAIVIIAIVVIKLFKKVLMVYLKYLSRKTETQADDVLVPVFGKIMTVVIWAVAAIMFFRTFGFDATALLGALGIAGLVIAFAAQDTLSNFFAGIMILLDRPFKEGDWIDLDGSVYQVRHIGLRSTRLFSSWSNQVVTLPNTKMSNLTFSNLTEPDILGRKTVKFGVAYDSNIDKVKDVTLEVVRSHLSVLEDEQHAIIFRFNEFGDSAINFGVTFFVKDYNDQWAVASDIRDRLFRRFGQEGIEIPFPQRVVHMKGESGSRQIGDMRPGIDKGPTNMRNLSP